MNRDSGAESPIQLVDATSAHRHAGLWLLAQAEPPSRRELLLNQLQAALVGERDHRLEAAAVQSGSLVGYFCGTRLGPDVAILLGPAVAPPLADAPAALRSLFDSYHSRLADAGIAFVQALREPEDDGRWLKLGGYRAIATLDYMMAPVPEDSLPEDPVAAALHGPIAASEPSTALHFETRRPEQDFDSVFCDAIEETYRETRDCPEISEFRSTRQVVRCYRDSPSFTPSCWMLARDCDGTVGVLITTPHAGTDTLELTYMGIAPHGRGRGYGAQLVAQAFCVARQLGLREVVLAVDQRNEPARAIYSRLGFSHLLSERVWVRAVGID